MISFRGISKSFPGQKALEDVSFDVAKGEIHALLGENGAGKSTLLNVFHGVFPPSAGEMFIEGRRTVFADTHEAIMSGIVKVHQEINMVPEMTVWENLFLGLEKTFRLYRQARHDRRDAAPSRRAEMRIFPD